MHELEDIKSSLQINNDNDTSSPAEDPPIPLLTEISSETNDSPERNSSIKHTGSLDKTANGNQNIEFDLNDVTNARDHDDELVLFDDSEVPESPENSHPLPGQQSLFDSAGASSNVAVGVTNTQLPMAEGENPFLPAHIRERLHQNKNSILEDLAHVGESLAKHEASIKNEASNEFEESPLNAHNITDTNPPITNSTLNRLVDELVIQYLPIIEKDLREKLLKQLKPS